MECATQVREQRSGILIIESETAPKIVKFLAHRKIIALPEAKVCGCRCTWHAVVPASLLKTQAYMSDLVSANDNPSLMLPQKHWGTTAVPAKSTDLPGLDNRSDTIR